MPKWTVTGPDGKQYRGVEAPSADEATRIVQGRVHGPAPDLGSPSHSASAPQDFGSTPLNLAAGVGQGLLDPIEGVGQMLEHTPVIGGAVRSMIPQGLRDWAKNYQQRVGSTTAGSVGEFAGNVLPFLFQPELGVARAASAVPRIGKALGFGGRVLERGTLPAVLEPEQPQEPTRDKFTGKVTPPADDFWTQKGEQALIGTGLGAGFEGAAGILGRLGRSSAARSTAANQATQSAAAQHAADLAAHQQGTLDRTAEQQARNTAKQARDAIPDNTTLRWQRETLARIGLADQAPTAVTPEGSARVQKLVGDRINSIMSRMHLDPNDPAFTDQINDIRDTTHRQLPESAQTRFYKEPPEEDLPALLVHPTTGKSLERTTRGIREKEPPKPSGDWQRTVVEPLAKGPLTQRELTDYVSRLGARAEELARQARIVPQDQRAELYAMSNAYRQVADAVIGHAAGSPEDKLALEEARKAYSMWSIGNDAGRAAQGGSMTPQRLIQTISRRMSEARYKQALADPNHPDRDLYQHLQQQLEELKKPLPTVRPASAVPRHPGKPPTPPIKPAAHPAAQAAANALLHWGLWHIPGLGHAAYWFGRPAVHAAANRVAPALSRAGSRVTGRGVRRAEAPVSAGAANVVKQAEEPDMSYSAPPGFRPR